jgi:hypothetical protein
LAALFLAACSSSSEPPRELVGSAHEAVDTICNQAASATLDGFPAYAYCGNFDVYTNNGVDTRSTAAAGWTKTEGGYGYQCVEWAVRYFYFKWGVSRTWFVGYAKDMCGTHPSDVSSTSAPIHGDIAVFTPGCAGADATAGHVAVIDTVASTTIGVVQQNPAGRMNWPKSCVACYLHAANNNGTNDPCVAAANGFYCGQSNQFSGGKKDVLYDCENGATKTATPCAYGCNVAPPGTPDSCNPAPPSDAGATHDASNDAAHASDGAPPPPSDDAGASSPPAPTPQAANDDAGANGATPDAASGSGGGCAIARSISPRGGLVLFAIAFAARALTARRRRAARTR